MIAAASAQDNAHPIDQLPHTEAFSTMLAAHRRAVEGIMPLQAALDEAAQAVAGALQSGATLFYAAAGSSGLMALADACELPGTFGIDPQQIRVCMAGGVPTNGFMRGDVEDATADALAAAAEMKKGDVALVLSASGSTPYALAFAKAAKASGNTVIGIANVARAPLLDLADIALAAVTGAEVVQGSTRLAAGTAQKVILNMISTQAGILMGHVYKGMMVNVVADNTKLRQRAMGIVMHIAGVGEETAREAMALSRNNVKLAVLIASGVDAATARDRLKKAKGHLSACLPLHNAGKLTKT